MSDQHLLTEDTANRETALDLASFIVEAPAGAGKTELLTQRYLKLLSTVESPEEIIAITFTNKAASEMKKRIMDSLILAASGVAQQEPHKIKTVALGQKALECSERLGWQLLDTPSRLRIYTIDSLSGSLARQMPLLTRFGTQPAVRDDAGQYYQEAASRTLAMLDDPLVGVAVQAALRYFDNNHYKLNALLADMLAKREQWDGYIVNQNEASIAEEALSNLVKQDMHDTAFVINDRIQEALMPVARYAASNLACDVPIALLRDWDSTIPCQPQALAMWRSVADLLLTSGNTLRKTVNVNHGFPATPEGKVYKERFAEVIETLGQVSGAESAIAKLRVLPNPKYDADTWEVISIFAALLKIASHQLWEVFQQHKEVDFVQVSQNALSALGEAEDTPTDLVLKLDYRIKHLLVDEFQDTSPSQIKLIERLTEGWVEGDGRTLFLVGDPMQSIYRFRKANVGLFLRVLHQGIGGLSMRPLKLWRNNRSHLPIIEWINQAFSMIFPSLDSVSRGAISYRPFVAKDRPPAGSRVMMHAMLGAASQSDGDEQTNDDESETADVNVDEANKIIQIIKATRAEDPQNSIAVLVRARNHLHALVAEIRRNHPDISFQAVEIEALANRQVIQDLLALTKALHQRADRVNWLAVLRAPWCGLTLEDLHHLVGNDQYRTVLSLMQDEFHLRQLSPDGYQRLLHVRKIMEEALAHRGRMGISRWVQGVWLMLGGPSCLWKSGDVRDAQTFFDLIEKIEVSGQFSTEQLALEVEKLYAAPDANASDKLQFMTIHKSKGLEFDTVILPGLHKTSGRIDQPLLMWEEVPRESPGMDVADVDLVIAPLMTKGKTKSNQTSIYDYLKSLEKERAAYEDARVLYVAATRAQRCLHLLAAVTPNKQGALLPKKNTFLEMLWPVVAKEFDTEKLTREKSISTAIPAAGASIKLADFIPQLIRLNKPMLPEIFSADEAHDVLKPIEMVEFEEDSVLHLEADIGILAHRYLELISNQGIEAWSVSRIEKLKLAMQRWFQIKGYANHFANEGAVSVMNLLKQTLNSSDGKWVLLSHNSAQNELAIERGVLNGEDLQVQRRVIDRTFIEHGVRWIIDYKSTALPANIDSAALTQVAEQYRQQLEQYGILFSHDGLPIKLAIYFLSVGKLVEL